jgi:hypothetical protein
MTDEDVAMLVRSLESDRVERKESMSRSSSALWLCTSRSTARQGSSSSGTIVARNS